MDDEAENSKPKGGGVNFDPAQLERWNVDDLNAYKLQLLAEIDRIDGVINAKSSVHEQAENLFKR